LNTVTYLSDTKSKSKFMEEYLLIYSHGSCLGGEIIFYATDVAVSTSDSSKPTISNTGRPLQPCCSSYVSFSTILSSTKE